MRPQSSDWHTRHLEITFEILGGMRERGKPWAPPLVEMSGGEVGHLLEWRQHERDGSWHAWVSWVQTTGDPPRHCHKVVSVPGGELPRCPAARAPQRRPDPAVITAGGRASVARSYALCSRPEDRAGALRLLQSVYQYEGSCIYRIAQLLAILYESTTQSADTRTH